MSVKIPLRYSNHDFAFALVDDDCEVLRDLGNYSVTLPRKLRSIARGRPDVILAYLREDPLTTRQCKPFLSLLGTQILLVHLCVRGELGRIVREFISLRDSCVHQPQKMVLSDINLIRGSIGRIVYVNDDCTDCRSDNIREV